MPLTLQLVDRGVYNRMLLTNPLGLFLLYPTYLDTFSKSPLLKTEHVVCYNLVESQKAMKMIYPQKTDLAAELIHDKSNYRKQ